MRWHPAENYQYQPLSHEATSKVMQQCSGWLQGGGKSHWAWKGKTFLGAIWCVAETPVGGRQEGGFIAAARKWQKGENECSQAGREVRWVTVDGLWTCTAMMLWSPAGSRASSNTKHVQSAQISSTPLCLSLMKMMCEFISSQIYNSAKSKWYSS